MESSGTIKVGQIYTHRKLQMSARLIATAEGHSPNGYVLMEFKPGGFHSSVTNSNTGTWGIATFDEHWVMADS